MPEKKPRNPAESTKIMINGRRRVVPVVPFRGDEVSQMFRIRISYDYLDAWSELSALQRGELVSEAIEARRRAISERDMALEP